MYYSKSLFNWYQDPGDDLEGRSDISQLADRLRREIELLAAEYDNALNMLQRIGLQASKQNGFSEQGRQKSGGSEGDRSLADMLDELNSMDEAVEYADAADDAGMEARRPVQRRDAQPRGRQTDWEAEREIPEERQRYAVDAGRLQRGGGLGRRRSRGTGIRTIEHEQPQYRISRFRKDGSSRRKEVEDEEVESENEMTSAEKRMIKCPGCGAELSEKSVVCVSCGEFLRR